MKKIITSIMVLFASTAFAADKGHSWNYTEVNTFVKMNDKVTLGYRFYDNEPKDYTQAIARYDFNNTWRMEYRNIQKSTGSEHWIRGQHKDFKSGSLFYNSRLEYRDRSDNNKSNIVRYRPQFGLKKSGYFAIFEPHFTVWDKDDGKTGYSHMQYFIGKEFKLNSKVTIAPQLQFESDKDFNVTKQFFTLDLKFKL
jgi:hypothetical protein